MTITVTQPTEKCCRTFRLGDRAISLLLEADAEGLTLCRIPEFSSSKGYRAEASHDLSDNIENPHLIQAIAELEEYFRGDRTTFSVPLHIQGTDFQRQVWTAACQIPFGQTRSYWWIAVRMGNPHAMRAVGGALGSNPLPLFIPCHRVVRQDGALGGFTGGIEWKRLLLDLEGTQTSNVGLFE